MISANELRIGNWFFIGHMIGRCNVDSFKDTSIFDPIPITEEWLLKFGFEKERCLTGFRYFRNDIMYHVNVYEKQFAITLAGCNFTLSIKYVHDFQNKIFALTEKELELK